MLAEISAKKPSYSRHARLTVDGALPSYKENEDESFLVLQDLSEKQCRVPQRIPPRNELEEALLILQKRAELSGIFYAWKENKIRSSANKHPFEPFVNIEI